MHFAFVSVSFYRSLVLLGSHGAMVTRNGGRFRYSMLLSRFRFAYTIVYKLYTSCIQFAALCSTMLEPKWYITGCVSAGWGL